MADAQLIEYTEPAAKVARIALNRPEIHNAQNTQLLYELNDANRQFPPRDVDHPR
jgi:1,4-dihydroxy-2-naphthoyl-CoA synthase